MRVIAGKRKHCIAPLDSHWVGRLENYAYNIHIGQKAFSTGNPVSQQTILNGDDVAETPKQSPTTEIGWEGEGLGGAFTS